MSVHDEAMAAQISTAMHLDMRVGGLPIEVRVCSGEVYLKGIVDTFEQIEVVRFIVSGIPGVIHVDTKELLVKGGRR